MLTKKQQRSIDKIRRLISLESCGVFNPNMDGTDKLEENLLREQLKQRMLSYLQTWVEIELLKIEGRFN